MCLGAIPITFFHEVSVQNLCPFFSRVVGLTVTKFDGCLLSPKYDLPSAPASGGSVKLCLGTQALVDYLSVDLGREGGRGEPL